MAKRLSFNEESFKEFRDLFLLYEGVEIIDWNKYEGKLYLRLRISEPKSILYLLNRQLRFDFSRHAPYGPKWQI